MEMTEQEPANGANIEEEQLILDNRVITSCLRNGNNLNTNPVGKNRVSFPEDEKDLVTGYLEPPSPWDNVPSSPDDLVAIYEESCRKHHTPPLEQVVDQLRTCWQPSPTLDLCGSFDLASLEALEPVLRGVRFQMLRFHIPELEDDAAVALFDMLEYYESTHILSITCDSGMGVRGWQACSRMIKKAHCLEELDARGTALNEQAMPILCRSLKVGSRLTSLKLGRCGLSGCCLAVLAAALRLNNTLQELSLADNELVSSDAVQLGLMLRVNNTLKVLDISNNVIQDTGCSNICEGLSEQKGEGLEALILWNTHLTKDSAVHLAMLLESSCPLSTLNIGQNRIGSEGLMLMKTEMTKSRTLKQLGVQAAQITCDGAKILSDILADNTCLQRIDARSNHIGVRGLTAIKQVLDNGACVQRLDLDDAPGVCQELVDEIRECCRINEAKASVEEAVDETEAPILSRKISLTCETLLMRSQHETNNNLLSEPKRSGRLRSPEPSPIPSPSSSPVPSLSRNRFRVSKVSENKASSRFKVTIVEPSTVLSSGHVQQVGFDCPVKVVTSEHQNSTGACAQPSSTTPSTTPTVSKPQSNLEKLLGLFQYPGNFFSSSSRVDDGASSVDKWEWDWKLNSKKTNSDDKNEIDKLEHVRESHTLNNTI